MTSLVRVLRCGVLLTGLIGPFLTHGVQAEETTPKFAPDQIEFFERHVRPVFVEHCQKCHGANQQKGGLRLDSRSSLLQGGDTGPAVAVEKPAESELLKAIGYDPDGYQMPPSGKLPAETIARLTEWVRMGAPWPEEKAADKLGPTPAEEFAKRSSYWSFQPLKRVAPPAVRDVSWPRTPIDRFVLSRLEQADLKPAPEIDRRTWLRRATFYATGLPPSPEEIHAFLDDQSPDAFERVVDRLLDSPRFGERWGRHWLDLARYAESRGHEFDYDVANPWHFRDYVVRAMNDDLPFDRFVTEQVAGDLLAVSSAAPREQARLHPVTGANESLVATGFWLLGEWVHSPVDIRKEESERFDNMIDVYGKAFLGLTIACARCHDHKFDPISQKDYYALAGYLQSSSYAQRPFDTLAQSQRIRDSLAELDRERRPEIVANIGKQTGPALQRLDEILLAAREALAAGEKRMETSTLPTDRVAEIAAERKLDPGLLKAWYAHLIRASADPSDPFAIWAGLATGRTKEASLAIEEARRLLPSGEASAEGSVAILAGDGVAFAIASPEPSAAKRMWPEAGAAGLPIRFAVPGETTVDPDFAGAQTVPGTMNEPGAVGRIPRGGRTLRTETFSITADRVYCRVRGACNTYLAVDSHITLNGPLHGGLYREHKAEAGWRWIEHDLSRYQGHRAHLEFIVPAGADFAVSEVRQAAKIPWQGRAEPGSPAAVLASALAGLSEQPSETMIAQRLRETWQQSAQTAPVMNWIVRHPELFGLDPSAVQSLVEPWLARRKVLTAEIPSASHLAPCLLDGNAEDEALHVRGNSNKLGDLVPRRFLGIFRGETPQAAEPGSGRLSLARQMVDPERTPILPRVLVNRLWHHAFGRGLVPTVDDFGHMGQLPSHPELLDWLATELLRNDWSLKALHRQILLSATFRMDTRDRPEQQDRIAQVDPQNLLLHRMNVQRLEGEAIRDAVLALSGRLDDRLYGPSVPIHLTSFLEGRGRPGTSGPIDGEGRRSLYLSVRRNFLEPFLVAFDFPTPHTTIGRRSVSNVPAQALALMNNPLIQQQSDLWAKRLLVETPSESPARRIERLYESAFGRLPTEEESARAVAFVESWASVGGSADDPRLWSELCHALVNVKEFVFLP